MILKDKEWGKHIIGKGKGHWNLKLPVGMLVGINPKNLKIQEARREVGLLSPL